METKVKSAPTRHATLQLNHHHQQTNNRFFTGRMPFLSPNQQCESTRRKVHVNVYVGVQCCAELISCSHHLSIQSAIVSSSPIKLHVSDSDDDRPSAELTDVGVDGVTMETADEEGEDCESVSSECAACDERERFALLDSPPVTVLTGK